MSNTAVKLSKQDIKQVMWRYVMTRQMCFNYETMQSGPWVWSMHPAMEKIYDGDKEVLREKYQSYFKFFNCHPWFGMLILMANLAVESTKAEDATAVALDVRTSLMGPLAGLGDAIVWVLLPTVTGAIAGYQALEGSLFGLVIAMVVNVALWMVFWVLSYPVYEKGVSFITDKAASLRNLTEACSILGIIIMGAMIVSTVKVNIGITWTVGDLTQNLNDLLNQVLPKFANIVTMCVLYWVLGKKNVKAGSLIWVLIAVAIALGGLGILK